MTDKAKAFIAALHRKVEPNEFQKFHNEMRIGNRLNPIRRLRMHERRAREMRMERLENAVGSKEKA